MGNYAAEKTIIDVIVFVDGIEYPELRLRDEVVVKIDTIETGFVLIEHEIEEGE